MTVRELIEVLQEQDPEAKVHFSYDYGDHWHTSVAPEVARVEDGRVTFSDYHRMAKLVDEDDERFDKAPPVVVLSS
jgi:hypothetical protein